MKLKTHRNPFQKTPEEQLRAEEIRRFWLYYASEEGNPYQSSNGNPSLADFKGLPDYIAGLFNYVPFIIDVDLHMLMSEFDVEAITGADGSEIADSTKKFADAVNFKEILNSAVMSALVSGDGFVKVVPDPDYPSGVRLIVLDSASVYPRLDPHDHCKVREILIDYRYRDENNSLRKYSELWTKESVEVRIDDDIVEELSGENPYNTIPICHFACKPLSGSYFGRPAFTDVISDIDKLNSAVGAFFEVFKYYGSPKLILKGIMAPGFELNPDVRQFWQIPSGDADLSFLEWKNAGGLVDEILKLDYIVRRKMPEFILGNVNDTNFPASGYAVSLQLSLLETRLSSLSRSFSRSAEQLLDISMMVAGKEDKRTSITLGKSFNKDWFENFDVIGKLMDTGVLTRDEARGVLGLGGGESD